MKKAIVGILPAIMLSGCASLFLPQGSEHYDCNRKENANSPYCHSFRGAEASTTTNLPQTRYDSSVKMSELDRMQGIAPASKNSASKPSNTTASMNYLPGITGRAAPLDGTPVREGPVVQRVWIKRHVDENDMLVGDMIVYKEIKPTHWSGVDPAAQGKGHDQDVFPHYPTADDTTTPQDASAQPTNQGGDTMRPPSTSSTFIQPSSKVSTNPVMPSSGQNDATNLPQ